MGGACVQGEVAEVLVVDPEGGDEDGANVRVHGVGGDHDGHRRSGGGCAVLGEEGRCRGEQALVQRHRPASGSNVAA